MSRKETVRVLMVCMGNICRSPMAQGVLEHLLVERGLHSSVVVDSAGTHGWHAGSPPDRRAQAAMAARGIDISGQRARQISPDDFTRFDYILVMDRSNLADIENRFPPAERRRVRLLLEFAGNPSDGEVPDPYYGGESGFDRVFGMVEDAAHGLIETLVAEKRGAPPSP